MVNDQKILDFGLHLPIDLISLFNIILLLKSIFLIASYTFDTS